ncbi:DNA-directed RNA polymerase subunit B, partial [archaeon]|nr:DNA-directed RNA polymerase subunit B [archaeon]
MKQGKVYINGRLIGFHPNPRELADQLIDKRRKSLVDAHVTIAFHDDTNEVYVNTDAGRVLRPLIVVEKGKPKLTPETIKEVEKGHVKWQDLVKKGVIEYLDSEEEENALIALSEEELSSKHTHLELDGNALFSVIESMIPYLEHNMLGKNLHGAKMFKQGVGLNGINYNLRTDTESHLLYYPERNLVKTRIGGMLTVEKRPDSQNFVVAVLPFYGFNLMDAIILNEGAVQRGLARSSYFRTYDAEEQQYPGGQSDKFESPSEDTVGFMGPEAYTHLGADGLVELEEFVSEKDVVIGRTSPPRFLEEMNEFGIVKEKRRESSVMPRKGKPGYVDKVVVMEGLNANKLVKIKVRSEMVPELGDKFSSKHGQKGVIGALIPEEDM